MNLRSRDLERYNLRLMLKVPRVRCLGLSQAISAQFTLKMCVAARNR